MNRSVLIKPVITLFILLCVIITGCSQPASIPVSTINWQTNSGGFIEYKTNDPGLTNTIHTYIFTNGNNPFIITNATIFEALVNKASGAYNTGFGILFGYNSVNSSYYVLNIETSGYYWLTQYVNSAAVTNIIPFTKSANIFQGDNVINDLMVTFTNTNSSSSYYIFINSNLTAGIPSSLIPGLSSAGPGVGYFVYVGYNGYVYDNNNQVPVEDFPSTPEDCYFSLVSGTN